MNSKETLNINESKHWSKLLSPEDQEKLHTAYETLFPTPIREGYEVVGEVGVKSGRLLRIGPERSRIQISVAHAEIAKRQRADADAADRALWTNPDWHAGMDHPKPEFSTVYVWSEQALLPPEYWQEGMGTLSVKELTLDRLGITIFSKTIPTPSSVL